MHAALRESKNLKKNWDDRNFEGAILLALDFRFACDFEVKSKCHPVYYAFLGVH